MKKIASFSNVGFSLQFTALIYLEVKGDACDKPFCESRELLS